MKTNKLVAKATIELGKIDYNNTGRRINAVTVEVDLRDCGLYREFSAMAFVYNRTRTDMITGGQCLDDINNHKYEFTPESLIVWERIYGWWKQYHLNGTHAGTPEQEKAADEWCTQHHRYVYSEVCEYLKQIGLYEVIYTGIVNDKAVTDMPYQYGTGWVAYPIPEKVEEYMVEFITEHAKEGTK